MFLNDHFNILLKIFYWSGLAPVPPVVSQIDKKMRRYGYIVSVIVSSLLNISLIAVSVKFQFYKSYGNIATIVNYAYIGTLSLTNLCANVQCYSYQAIHLKIICRIERIINSFNCKFSEKISVDSVVLRYKLKILLISVILFVTTALKFYESWLDGSYPIFAITSLTIVCQCMSVLVLLHAILYIVVVDMFIVELNRRIRNAPICFYLSSKMEFLKTVKSMHMDIFKLMLQINEFFSWSLPLLVIHLAVQATYYFYWIFLILQVEWNLLYISGMYMHIQVI